MTLAKGRQQFVFRYFDGQESELLAALVRLAGDPAVDFDWFDAAALGYQMGKRIGNITDRHVAVSP